MPDLPHNDESEDEREAQIDPPSVRKREQGIEQREFERC